MTISRRRVLQITAAALVTGGAVPEVREVWRGVALGAEAEITLVADDRARARAALAAARAELARLEALFSLYEPSSALNRLNQHGVLSAPPPDVLALMAEADAVYRASDGAFDPTIQPLWSLLARTRGRPNRQALAAVRELLGWQYVQADPGVVRLRRSGMALTFNGIAQGFATDRIAELLAARGFRRLLVNVGEFRGLGLRPWRIGVAEPGGRLVETISLFDGAVATTSPGALTFRRDRPGEGPTGHVLDPRTALPAGAWQLVTVLAGTAARADGLSTAIAAAPVSAAETILRRGGARRAILVDRFGAKREWRQG
ncbi:MAG: FAD:protein FMN transferase [Rhodospirillales bacterium]|nr:FAD:protein FMN transferase [Rhodospirillales bacterium]MDH3912288.1 FAD:protein FMN transferase [Rhodospirillales bacterium]MDH3917411.1 FAD:protein FMN transferase [Rhodospirillales bacterium]MDH3967400.1 FAD:protein FMN transferase [Rhodospirillales bacterium]